MKKLLIISLILFIASSSSFALSPQQIVAKVNDNYSKIKDATADLTLQYNLHLFGCTGVRKQTGIGYYKHPDKIKAIIDKITYFAQGNKIRKIDDQGKRFYVKLINAPDMSPGFTPQMITHNFNLSISEEKEDKVVLLGLPKPGVLKNVKEIYFHIDTKEYLLRQLDMVFHNKKLSGKILVDYEKIKGLWVPIGFHGQSAVEVAGGLLVGLDISLSGKNFKINTGLPDKLFEPGF
ncbi:MAG: hypothetical protein ABIH69_05815 [bacterium]|nr:hypothetical protein [Candidatus Margulisiibacteriota bacterium]